MHPDILALYDDYTHRPLSRAVFLERLAKLAGGTAAALTLLPLLESNYAHARVAATDRRLSGAYITYPAGEVQMRAYLAKPEGQGPWPAVVVIHENRGLNPHIEDVTRRLALAGFIGLAPDALSPLGGTPADADQARGMFQQLDGPTTVQQFAAAYPYLQGRADCTGAFGCVGFCWGGAMANSLAVAVPALKAAVPFYGRQAPLEDVPKIKAALQLHYAETDERINAGIDAYRAALEQHGIEHQIYTYPGTGHAFHNDTSTARYNPEAAKLAWARTVAFFEEKLK